MGTMVIYLYKMLLNWYEKVGKYTNADDIVATTGMDNMDAAILADKMKYQNCWNNKQQRQWLWRSRLFGKCFKLHAHDFRIVE